MGNLYPLISRHILIFIIGCVSYNLYSQNPVKIMPLGNSITQGEGSSVSSTGLTYNTWRRNLYKNLVDTSGYNVDFVGSLNQAYACEDYPDLGFDHDHEGHWAWTIDDIVYGRSGGCSGEGRLGEWVMAIDTPDFVLVHLGTNDCWGSESVQSSVDDFENLIDTLRHYNPEVTIFMAQIIGHRDAGVDQCIQELNDSIAEITLREHTIDSPIELVDQYTGFDPFIDCYDSAHPDESGESKIATNWFNALVPFLESTVSLTGVSINLDNFDNSIILNWTSSIYPAPKEFFVERSFDLGPFQTIGTVTSNALDKYEFIDDMVAPASESVFYRIKWLGEDGIPYFSDILNATVIIDKLVLYPNPIEKGQLLTVNLPGIQTISIYSLNGQIHESIQNKNPGDNISFELNNYSPGMFFLKIETDSQIFFSRLIIHE